MIQDATISALKYLLQVIPFIIIGVVLAELIVALKFVNKIAWLTKPITRFAHLRKECGISFLTAFASPAAANSMLMEFYTKELLNKRELIIASLANSFPATVVHWKFIVPVIVPLLGVTGIIYFGVLVAIGFIKTFLVLAAGRVLLAQKSGGGEMKKEKRPSLKEAFKISLRRSQKTLRRILLMIIPITIIIFILIDLGVFNAIADCLSGIAGYLPIPPEGLPIIAAQFANVVAAWTIAGNLLFDGILNSKEIILTLLVGTVLSSIVELRYSIPYYLGIFGAKLGVQILVTATVLRMIITILMVALLTLWW